MQIAQSFSTYAEGKLSAKLDRFFEGDADAKITLSEQKNLIVLELTVKAGSMIYRAEQTALDKNDALDAAIDKIIRQICKIRASWASASRKAHSGICPWMR